MVRPWFETFRMAARTQFDAQVRKRGNYSWTTQDFTARYLNKDTEVDAAVTQTAPPAKMEGIKQEKRTKYPFSQFKHLANSTANS